MVAHVSFWISLLSAIAKILRWMHAERVVWFVRERAILSILSAAHLGVIHKMRRLAFLVAKFPEQDMAASGCAFEICNECQKLMASILELPATKLHCCLKLMAPNQPDGEERVATWVRSEPFDARPVELGNENAHSVKTNSVWSSLLGRSDSKTVWQPFNCFACNDLPKRSDLFCCDRNNWQLYYRSCLVFPLRYAKNPEGTEMGHIGFLAFDSPMSGAFRGLPDIFDHRENPSDYLELLHRSAVFHLGALLADTLGALLGADYARASESSRRGG